jgi:hypothetical protein
MAIIKPLDGPWAAGFSYDSENDRSPFRHFLTVEEITAGGILLTDTSGLSRITAGGYQLT